MAISNKSLYILGIMLFASILVDPTNAVDDDDSNKALQDLVELLHRIKSSRMISGLGGQKDFLLDRTHMTEDINDAPELSIDDVKRSGIASAMRKFGSSASFHKTLAKPKHDN